MSKEGASNILELLLAHAPSIPCNLRILITSRPESHIRADKAQNLAKVVLHGIEKTVVNNDTERFVRHGLQVVYKEYDLSLPNYADVVRLVKKSGGLFIFASTALRYISDNIAGDSKTCLEVILGDKVNYKSKPYFSLDKLYWIILDKVFQLSTIH